MQDLVDKRIEELEKEIKSLKGFSLEAICEDLEKLGLESFSWTQYTPYSSDGEACEFSVNEDLQGIVIDGIEYGSVYSLYKREYGDKVFLSPEAEKIYCIDLIEMFGGEEVMKDLFGDHAECTLRVREREVTVCECDHD